MNASSKQAMSRIVDAKERVLGADTPDNEPGGPGGSGGSAGPGRSAGQDGPGPADPDSPAHGVVGEQVLASWRRSQLWGVSTDHLDPPYLDQVETDGELVTAARPVLDRLESALSGTAMSIVLTDAHGQVIQRRTGENSLQRHLDDIRLAPGFSYAEEHVGTNGIGSAIESRLPFFVAGAEHFAHPLATVSCAGAPILQPLTGRLQGVLDLTCRSSDATTLMKVLAEEAAAEVTQRLLEQRSVRERALLQRFLAASHNSSRAVIAVIGDVVISNAMATGTLERGDYALVQDQAADLIRSGASVMEILLSNGDRAYLRARAAGGSGANGVVVEVTLAEVRKPTGSAPGDRHRSSSRAGGPAGADTPSDAVGRSGAWAVTAERVDKSCRTGERLLVVGEPGDGKLTLLSAAHNRLRSDGPLRVVDLVDVASERGAIEGALARQLDPGAGTVVLRHLDAVPDALQPVVAEWIECQAEADGPWICGTLRAGDIKQALGGVTMAFAAVVTVPPLRHRIEDVRDLVPALVERLAPGRGVTVAAEAMQTLLRHPWPGNVTELEDVVRGALVRRPRGRISGEDLPETAHSTARQVLSPWAAMERDLITRTLIETKGDKVAAASRLGISRATIYRKLRTYGIVLSGIDNDR